MWVIRFALCRVYHSTRFRSKGISFIGSNCRMYLEKGSKLTFGSRVGVSDDVELLVQGTLSIGDRTTVNRFSRIVCFEKISIGQDVMLAQFVTILDHDHDLTIRDTGIEFSGYVTEPISIGNSVWIGEKVTILKGCSIGDNVIVAAHSLVNCNVPSNSVVAGCPAKIVRSLV